MRLGKILSILFLKSHPYLHIYKLKKNKYNILKIMLGKKNKKILIVGGTGFLGYHAAKFFIKKF